MLSGMLLEYIRNQGTGWEYALRMLEVYFHAALDDTRTPDLDLFRGKSLLEIMSLVPQNRFQDKAGTHLQAAATLGERTAEMHLALASDPDDPAFAPEPLSSVDLTWMAHDIHAQVEHSIQLLESRLDELAAPEQKLSEELMQSVSLLFEPLEDLPTLDIQATRIRCHGDLHLGQVLRTENDFVILDFEGEPLRSLAERRLKVSPLRDVAGMLRSFDYAAHAALDGVTKDRPEDRDRLAAWARSWPVWMSATFLKSYLATAAGADFIPRDPAHVTELLRAFLVEKALYELTYELNNRPAWLRVPLQSIHDLIEETRAIPQPVGV
jgi:maltose alpha-D-glucosyltransferase/alpha-amylase